MIGGAREEKSRTRREMRTPVAQPLRSAEDLELQRALDASRREAEEASALLPALVREPQPLTNLAHEYASGNRSALYEAKAAFLDRRYQAIRRVRGDGNCLYRGFHTSWMEWLLRHSTEQTQVWRDLIPSVSKELAVHLPEPLGAELVDLGTRFAQRTSVLCDSSANETTEARSLTARPVLCTPPPSHPYHPLAPPPKPHEMNLCHSPPIDPARSRGFIRRQARTSRRPRRCAGSDWSRRPTCAHTGKSLSPTARTSNARLKASWRRTWR